MRNIIYPYKLGSRSAKAITEGLGGIRVRPNGKYRPRQFDRVINWGSSTIPRWYGNVKILNDPRAVAVSSDKVTALQVMKGAGVSVPKFCLSADRVKYELEGKVYCRTLSRSSQGKGIVIKDSQDLLPRARLYTQAIDIKAEYRVHVFNGQVIDYVKKRRRCGDEPQGEVSMIRNHANGWIFTRENLNRLEKIEQIAIKAVKALGLDFGAVDIVRDMDNEVFVLEVNTAIGMEGTTLQRYIEAFNNYNYAIK